MSKQDPEFTSDNLKLKIKDFNKRKVDGKAESMKRE